MHACRWVAPHRTIVRTLILVAVIGFPGLTHAGTSPTEGGVTVGRGSAGADFKLAPNVLDGSLTHEVPLAIPPGRNGVQPSLSLTYNSNARSQSNLFGYGWDVSVPYIERRNYAGTEQMFSHAAFFSSLSGDLASTSDPTIFKEKVSDGDYLTYTFVGNGWTVTDRNGLTYKFGTASSSQLYATSSPSNVSKFMLDEIRDLNGNYVSFAYAKDGNQIYPDTITYTGNGATPGIFDIVFVREARGDIATSSALAVQTVTKQRIKEIQARVNGSWVRKYALGYGAGVNGSRSVLTSITEHGFDGVATTSLPAVTFSYLTPTKSWIEDTYTDVPYPFVDENYVDYANRPADVNGDGLTDLIIIPPQGGLNRVYMNNGSGWHWDTSWTIPVPLGSLTDIHPGALVVDVNGDGRTDIAVSKEGGTNTIYMNNGKAWVDATTTIPIAFARSNGRDNGVRLADVNGDGLADLVRGWGTNRVYINNGSNWIEDTSWSVPEGTLEADGLTDTGLRFADVNGDGLADILRHNETIHKVYLNNGTGWTHDPTWSVPNHFVTSAGLDRGLLIDDINGDGLADLIQSIKVSGSLSGAIWINNGAGWTLDNSWDDAPIPITEYVSSVPKDAGTRLVDMNGDGLPDIVAEKKNSGTADFIYLNSSTKSDLLSTTTTKQGGSIAVRYQASPLYRDGNGTSRNRYLPLGLDTVKQLTYDSGLASWDTSYVYEGGLYTASSTRDRKFVGFEKIWTTDDLGNTTKEYFHQGSTTSSSLGEYDDHLDKIGKMFRREVYDDGDDLYAATIYKWDRYDRGDGASLVKLTQTLDLAYDGDGDHRDKAESFTYSDTAGVVAQKVEWGEVSGGDDGTFSDSGSDKLTTVYSYATSTATSTILAVSQETTTDQSAGKVRETRTYYDTLSLGSLNKANPTKVERWKASSTYVDVEKTYNAYGLVTQESDPRNKATTFDYDAFNLYAATTTNPLSQAIARTFDYSSGRVATTTDANGRVFATVFDGVDRPVEEKQPDLAAPSTLVTKASYQYTDGSVPRSVQKTTYLNAATSTVSHTYSDGFGRKVEERTEAEGSNYVVRDFSYDPRGLLASETVPFFSTGTSFTGVSSPASASRRIEYAYDALGRVTEVSNALGDTTHAYDQWETTTTDPEGNVKEYTRDAYGRLVAVVEHDGGSTYDTAYEYDGNGGLTKVTDDLGNVRNFTFDGLGRRLTAQDLHDVADGTFGTWSYTYDDAGNVTSYTDPKSQTVDLTYDDVNRVLTEDHTGAAGTEIAYGYDACTNGVGRLCAATTSAAVSSYVYSALGLAASETKKIGSSSYATSYTYDRAGNLAGLTYPDGSEAAYRRDAAGLLETVAFKEPGGTFADVITGIDYAPTGKVQTKRFANGVVSTYTFDPQKLYRLVNITTVDEDGESLMGGGEGSFELASALLLEFALATDAGLETQPPTVETPTAPVPEAVLPETPTDVPGEELPAPVPMDPSPILPTGTTTPPTDAPPAITAPEALPPAATSTPTAPVIETPLPEVPFEAASTTPEQVLPTKTFLLDAPMGRVAAKDANVKSEQVGVTPEGDPIIKARIHSTPVRYVDASGATADIDVSLADEGSAWVMTHAPFGARLAKRSDEKAITYRTGSTELYLSPAGTEPKSAAGAKDQDALGEFVRYADALASGIDLEVRLDTNALRKDAVIRNAQALQGSASASTTDEFAEVSFLLESNEPIELEADGQRLSEAGSFTTSDGVKIASAAGDEAYFWAPIAVDADGSATSIEIAYEATDGGVVLTKRIPRAWLEQAVFPIRTDTVVSYYPDGSGDGDLEHSGIWDNTHDATSGSNNNTGATTARVETKHTASNSTYRIKRVSLPFDTSGLPDNAVIDAAQLQVRVTVKDDGDDDQYGFLRVVQTTVASPFGLTNSDYDTIGAVDNPAAGAPDVDITSTSQNNYATFTLDSTGRSWINLTGFTKLGLREGHDASDVPVTDDRTSGVTIGTQQASGTTNDPVFEVTYHANSAPSVPSGLLAEGQTNPVGVTDATPELSAIYEDADASEIAVAYRIQVSTSTDFSSLDWDSAKTTLGSSTPAGMRIADVSYDGTLLASSTPYYWRIKFWDDDNTEGAWSTATSTFTLAGNVATDTNLIQDISFAYDRVGNILQMTDRSGTGAAKTVLFGYDDLYRLTSASTTAASSTPFAETYAYSSIGNLTSKSGVGSYTYAETGHANPHAATSINGTSLTYDNNGNVTAYGSDLYSWNYRNRLATSTNGVATTTYGYDHQDQRVKKVAGSITTLYPSQHFSTENGTSTRYIWAGDDLLAYVESTGSATTTHFVHADHLGSTNAVTDDEGEVGLVSDYLPYGSERLSTGEATLARGFIGQFEDADDLSYLNARYYSSDRGQFLSQDPVFAAVGDARLSKTHSALPVSELLKEPQRLNAYAYAGNNPLRYADPNGKDYWEITAQLDANPVSFSLSARIDPKAARVDIGYGGGFAAGASGSVTAFYNEDELPEANSYITETGDITVGYGPAFRGSAGNTQDVSIPTRSTWDTSVTAGVGLGAGASASANINYNFTLIDVSRQRGFLIEFQRQLDLVARAVKRLSDEITRNSRSGSEKKKPN